MSNIENASGFIADRPNDLATVIYQLPAPGQHGNVDPIFAAIATREQAKAAYDVSDDDESYEFGVAESNATFTALMTIPTTLQGLRAFAEFGHSLLREIEDSTRPLTPPVDGEDEDLEGLGNWCPGFKIGNKRTAEQLFHATLTAAVVALLPKVGERL